MKVPAILAAVRVAARACPDEVWARLADELDSDAELLADLSNDAVRFPRFFSSTKAATWKSGIARREEARAAAAVAWHRDGEFLVPDGLDDPTRAVGQAMRSAYESLPGEMRVRLRSAFKVCALAWEDESPAIAAALDELRDVCMSQESLEAQLRAEGLAR